MKKKWFCVLISVIVLVCIAFPLALLLSRCGLSPTRYEMAVPGFSAPIRIVQLTDLHNSEFGEGNSRLIDKVREQKPDLILVTGDLLNLNEERTDIATTLIRALAQIAPVYVSYGNHEAEYEERFDADLRDLYTEAGATVLEREWVDLDLDGEALRIGGIYGYCLPAKYLTTGEAKAEECAFLEEFQNTERTTLLLCHIPVCWIRNGGLDEWNVDLVFSGHIHGGQIRLPWIGGLWAPDFGWFPGRCSGLYHGESGSGTLVLSRGLGNTDAVPRLNNTPEILVLDLVPMQ